MKVVGISNVAFDAMGSLYHATVTVAGPTALALSQRRVAIAGHRSWSPDQVAEALATKALG